jgi:hypothetical protein
MVSGGMKTIIPLGRTGLYITGLVEERLSCLFSTLKVCSGWIRTLSLLLCRWGEQVKMNSKFDIFCGTSRGLQGEHMKEAINERRATGLLIVFAGILTLMTVWNPLEKEDHPRRKKAHPLLFEPNRYFPLSGMP